MIGPTQHGNATAVVCGTCGEHIERAIWAADADLTWTPVMCAFIATHERAGHHRVTSLRFEPMVLAWHEL